MGISNLLLSLTIGVSSNLDNIGIGLSYGIKKTRIPWLFCALTSVMSLLACLVGGFTSRRISHILSGSLCHLLGSSILIAIGAWILIHTFISKGKADNAIPEYIGFHEMMLIGVAQAMTDLSVGFGTGFTGLSIVTTALSIGLFSFVCLYIPANLGTRITPVKFGRSATILSGIILIAVGLVQ